MSTTIRVALCVVAVGLATNCSTTSPAAPGNDAGTLDTTSPVVANADASLAGDGGADDATLADAGGSSFPDAGSLAGTWTVTTTAMGAVVTMLTIGQDSLDMTSPDFTLTATRTGPVLGFTDNDPPGDANTAVLSGTQEAGAFYAGIVPFDLGGSWTIQAGPKGAAATVTCTLHVSAAEIDGACQNLSPSGPWFNFTSQKLSTASSSLGDFGGKWNNTWTWSGTGGGTYPCLLDFAGNSITTCDGGALNGEVNGSPLAGIMFTYDGMNMVSGSAQGWAEFSATR